MRDIIAAISLCMLLCIAVYYIADTVIGATKVVFRWLKNRKSGDG